MSANTNTLLVTRDEIMANRDRKVDGRYCFMPDGNRMWFDLLSFKEGYGFAESTNTGCLFLVVVTGKVARGGVIRAQAIPAVDTGDMAGTLLFDPAQGKVPGTVNADLYFRGPQ